MEYNVNKITFLNKAKYCIRKTINIIGTFSLSKKMFLEKTH